MIIKNRFTGQVILEIQSLPRADLRGRNLQEADLRGTDFLRVDFWGADFRGADFRGTNLDFSCFPLWCGSFDIKADLRLAAQIAYHFCRIDFDGCLEAQEAQKSLMELANKFHRIGKGCEKVKF